MNETDSLAMGLAGDPGGRRLRPFGRIDAEIIHGTSESARRRPDLTVYYPKDIELGGGVRAHEIVDLRIDACRLISYNDACVDVRMGSHHHSSDIDHLLRFWR